MYSSGQSHTKTTEERPVAGRARHRPTSDAGNTFDIVPRTDASAALGAVSRRGVGKTRNIDTQELRLQSATRNREVVVWKVVGEEKLRGHAHGEREIRGAREAHRGSPRQQDERWATALEQLSSGPEYTKIFDAAEERPTDASDRGLAIGHVKNFTGITDPVCWANQPNASRMFHTTVEAQKIVTNVNSSNSSDA